MGADEAVLLVSSLLALALLGIALALAVAALTARALFVATVFCMLLAAVASAAMLARDGSLPAIALLVFGAGLSPLWLLGGVLLSSSAIKARRRGAPWLTVLASLATAAIIVTVSPELGTTHAAGAHPVGIPMLLAALMFVAAIVVCALLGYGERGALGRARGAA
ncbi:MAG: hypothetical protein JSS00_01080 [Proteobacteria bacterium]|nr:hypothetical protein [Pseudomonadota bacterium]